MEQDIQPFVERHSPDQSSTERNSGRYSARMHTRLFLLFEKAFTASSPLLVCHRWRNLIASNPVCWSRLKLSINTNSNMKYVRSQFSDRDTKSKIIQDNIDCIFRWARSCPIDLDIEFLSPFLIRGSRLHSFTGSEVKCQC